MKEIIPALSSFPPPPCLSTSHTPSISVAHSCLPSYLQTAMTMLNGTRAVCWASYSVTTDTVLLTDAGLPLMIQVRKCWCARG